MIKVHYLLLSSLIILLHSMSNPGYAQGCVFKDTLLKVDFGNASVAQNFNLKSLRNYQQDNSACPDDGAYAVVHQTLNCFNGDWISLMEDRTTGDIGGKMMIINASHEPGVFFMARFSGFEPSTDYEFGAWLINLRKVEGGCADPIPPEITFSLETSTGKIIASFNTGKVEENMVPIWKKYFGMFKTPANETNILLKMTNRIQGGCGNDFAMDDITFRKCYPDLKETQEPKTRVESRPVIERKLPVPIEEEQRPLKKEVLEVDINKTNDKRSEPAIQQKKIVLPPPSVLQTRENLLLKEISVNDGDITIEVYDNGIIDGDTISIYHNNALIVSKKGLSEKPISLKIKVGPENSYNEFVMVADNLGGIPPNTSLMVITAGSKRFEVFVSSSETKNAKIIIRRNE